MEKSAKCIRRLIFAGFGEKGEREMKRTWKPIDLGGLRLYEVHLYWYPKLKENPTQIDLWKAQNGKRETYIVVASKPSKAAEIIENIYKESYDNNPNISHWHVKGYALNILQPEDWKQNGVPCPDCEPERFRMFY
jgi:hypothetical protein